MDTMPLPPQADLDRYYRLARDLVAAAGSADADAVRNWATEWVLELAKALGVTITPSYQAAVDRAVSMLEKRVVEQFTAADATQDRLTLEDARRLIANAHGFESWTGFSDHLEGRYDGTAGEQDFEAAADAVVGGDLATLEALVRKDPELVRARSGRVHQATLLHYVSANGVEDYRQRTPPNAVAVAKFLLESGAEVDALAKTYGGGSLQTTMNLLVSSAHPAGAGLQAALVEVLLDFGAAINGLQDDESPLLTALDFGYADSAETLARRGARVDTVVTAAALGRLDLVTSFVVGSATLQESVPLLAPPWAKLPDEPKAHIELALAWACKFRRDAVAEYLLDRGVNPAAKDGYKMSALHWAAANGCLELVNHLLDLGAPLEVENTWEGTVLDSTLYCAMYQPVEGVNYPAVLETLLVAGADIRVLDPSPTGNTAIDEVLERYRSNPG